MMSHVSSLVLKASCDLQTHTSTWSERCIVCRVSLKLCCSVVLYCIFQASAFIAHLISVSLSYALSSPRFAITASNLLAGPLLPPPPVCYGPTTNPPSGNLPLLNAPPAPSLASSSSKQFAGTCWQKGCLWGVCCSLKKVSDLKKPSSILDVVKEVLIIVGFFLFYFFFLSMLLLNQDIQPGARSCFLSGVFLHYSCLFLWWDWS